MIKTLTILSAVVLLGCGNVARASDGFGAVRCGSDIPKTLIGRAVSNERDVEIEGRHKDLGLKDLGGSDISDRLFLASWRICGDEYQLLEEKDIVRDALKFPTHSKDAPEFIGTCRIHGKQMPDTIIAILENRKGVEALPATAAWKIDKAGKRLIKLSVEGLLCPRDGVITSDGGP
jgi:hypothetical protein